MDWPTKGKTGMTTARALIAITALIAPTAAARGGAGDRGHADQS